MKKKDYCYTGPVTVQHFLQELKIKINRFHSTIKSHLLKIIHKNWEMNNLIVMKNIQHLLRNPHRIIVNIVYLTISQFTFPVASAFQRIDWVNYFCKV